MLLIHDIVEIDAGDTFLYAAERQDATIRERAAAQRIFGLLDESHKKYFIDLWEEFEARETPEAKYAAVFDRLEPIYQNYLNGGASWKANGVRKAQVLQMSAHLADCSPEIWEFIEYLVDDAVKKGFLAE
jgi:putative hydrolase of HD superfamily